MRVIENKELPNFSKGISEEGVTAVESEEHPILKPTVVKPALVPQISFTFFASPEAQKALKFINGDEEEDKDGERCVDKDENDNEKENVQENEQPEVSDKPNKTQDGIQSRYRWRVVARTVKGCQRLQAPITNSVRRAASPCRGGRVEMSSPMIARRASIGVSQGVNSFTPTPPKTPRHRRMSLSPSRHPLLPNRHRAVSPAPACIHKTSSDSSLDGSESSQEPNSQNHLTSSSSNKTDEVGGSPVIARALLRRRFSLPVSPGTPLIPPHPPSPIYQARSSSTECDRSSPASSTGTASPTVSTISSCSKARNQRRNTVTSSLQANREKLESLMKERSRAIANLTVGGSRENIPSPSTTKPKQEGTSSPSPIRAKHSLPRPTISRTSSVTLETDTELAQSTPIESISSLDPESLGSKAAVVDVGDCDVESVKSDSTNATVTSLDDSALRSVGGRPIFKRHGSSSFDSGISISDTASVVSEQETTSSVRGDVDDDTPRMTRLRQRRGTICVSSLSSLLVPISAGARRSSSSSPHSFDAIKVSQRSEGDIEQDVEDELQRRIMQRKSQLLIQAAPGSSSLNSAVSRLQNRAACKTTNGRLRKIMNNLTMERTTAELLSMKAAMIAASKRNEEEGLRKTKSLDYD